MRFAADVMLGVQNHDVLNPRTRTMSSRQSLLLLFFGLCQVANAYFGLGPTHYIIYPLQPNHPKTVENNSIEPVSSRKTEEEVVQDDKLTRLKTMLQENNTLSDADILIIVLLILNIFILILMIFVIWFIKFRTRKIDQFITASQIYNYPVLKSPPVPESHQLNGSEMRNIPLYETINIKQQTPVNEIFLRPDGGSSSSGSSNQSELNGTYIKVNEYYESSHANGESHNIKKVTFSELVIPSTE